jgi:transposase
MSEARSVLSDMQISQAEHLPLVAAFLERMGLAAVVNAAAPTEMAVDLGSVVTLMILDTLSGRSPLYRLERFAAAVDTELLLGREVSASAFNDTTLGRALEAIYEHGAGQLFSQVALGAAAAFPAGLDLRHLHFDTTSVSVWGEYAACEADGDGGLRVTYGYSKDLRPDLKQFLIEMLCAGRNIPVLGGCADGNASDKTVNNAVLTNLSKHMARHGLAAGAFVYVADAAMVTPANLAALGGNLFITRLPFTYAEAERVVAEAVQGGDWMAGPPPAPSSGTRKAAAYCLCERPVTIEEHRYRAIVVHSDAADKRRQKKLERALGTSLAQATETLKAASRVEYFCCADAAAAAAKLAAEAAPFHVCECTVKEQLTYARGRPPKSGERKVSRTRYVLEGRIVEREGEIERLRQAAGCFVLLTNVPTEGEMAHTPGEVLIAYKEQHGIERNFAFLKDPLIVNDLFLKRPERIEALGFILLASLLTWNLMEHVMREHLKRAGATISGWDRKPTSTPTTFMMTTKFKGVLVARIGGQWHFTAPLSGEQLQYVEALGLSEEALLRRGEPPAQESLGRGRGGWGM